MLSLDPVTRAEYDAAETPAARAAVVMAAITGTVTATVYDGSDVARGSGTMQTPWASIEGTRLVIGELADFMVTNGGTPDANWYLAFEAGTRWLRGSFGLSGADFNWSLATFATGQGGRLGTVEVQPQGFEPVSQDRSAQWNVLTFATKDLAPSWSVEQSGTAPNPLSASFPASISVAQGREYSLARHVTGGTAPLAYAATGLPANVTLNASTGMLTVSGAATIATTSITVTVTDAASGNQGGSISLSVTAAPTISGTNTLTFSSDTTISNYPYQFGRAFVEGVIKDYPQVLIDGTPIPTQADVKNRWPDGSVKFAVISVILPTADSTTRTISFQNQVTTNSTPVTRSSMLADYDFEAQVRSATTMVWPTGKAYASARDMLSATSDTELVANTAANSVNSRYWTQGPICTTVILCDHTNKAFDFGPDANKSLRPIFHVQFWPAIGKCRVRVIVEGCDFSKLGDWTWDVEVRTGNSSPAIRYSKSAVFQGAMTRWTRRYWIGADYPSLDVKPNLEAIAATKAILRYDPSITTYSRESELLATWAGRSKDIYSGGLWEKAMGTAGGRSEIAMIPGWYVNAAVSGSKEMFDLMETQADLFAAFPFFYREGATGRTISGVDAIGRNATRSTRPTLHNYDRNSYLTAAFVASTDRPTFVTAWNNSPSGFVMEVNHVPNTYQFPYLWTGDYWYLENLIAMGSWANFTANPGNDNWASGRSSQDGVVGGEPRGRAWQWRNLAYAGIFCPDGWPEKEYYMGQAGGNARAVYGRWSGEAGTDPVQSWWAANGGRNGVNPLRFIVSSQSYWNYGNTSNLNNTSDNWYGHSPWQCNYTSIVSAHLAENGVDGALEYALWHAPRNTAIVTETDPKHLTDYAWPMVKDAPGYPYFQTVTDMFDSNPSWTLPAGPWAPEPVVNDIAHNYIVIALAAEAALSDLVGSVQPAYTWLAANTVVDFSKDMGWGIVPR